MGWVSINLRFHNTSKLQSTLKTSVNQHIRVKIKTPYLLLVLGSILVPTAFSKSVASSIPAGPALASPNINPTGLDNADGMKMVGEVMVVMETKRVVDLAAEEAVG